MKASLAIALILLVFLVPLHAEDEAAPAKPAVPENPDDGPDPKIVQALGRNALIASWLAGYDVTAWDSADEFVKEPEEERGRVRSWFCYPEDDGWHAVYGRVNEETGAYERLYHYLLADATGVKKLTDLATGQSDLALHRAFVDGRPRLMQKPQARRCRFNVYVRQTDAAVEVWAHPEVTRDWTIVYGIAFCWRYSQDGTEFKQEEQRGQELHGIKPQREEPVLIGDPESEFPGLSEMYVVQRFGSRFEEIAVRSKSGISRIMDSLGWVHVMYDGAGEEEEEAEEGGKGAEEEPAEED